MESSTETTCKLSFRFKCQSCGQPLRVLDPADMPGAAEKVNLELQASASSSSLAGDGGKSSESSDQFTILGSVACTQTLSCTLQSLAGIFDIFSGEEVDHPLCEDCTDRLLEHLDTQLNEAQLDCQAYSRALEPELLMNEEDTKLQTIRLQEDLWNLKRMEETLTQELEDAEQTWAQTAEALRASEAETEELQQLDVQCQKDICVLEGQNLELTDQLSSLENQLRYTQGQLDKLSTTNIFEVTFQIWEEGPLGVINNFRLGYIPQVAVDWTEINAAWGQTALLLLALANTIGLKFQRYQLVACGNHSYLKSLTNDGVTLPLFSDGQQNVFPNNKYDLAMMAFLDCMQQFKNEAEKETGWFSLPYSMHPEQGTICDDKGSGKRYSIQIQTRLNTMEEWTMALKLLLVNLKWSLAWASGRYRQK
ncbi:beclin-2 [Thomomys bottae]